MHPFMHTSYLILVTVLQFHLRHIDNLQNISHMDLKITFQQTVVMAIKCDL